MANGWHESVPSVRTKSTASRRRKKRLKEVATANGKTSKKSR